MELSEVFDKKLGFGCLRLPHHGDDASDVDVEQMKEMVDLFLERGFRYFDTAYSYLDYKSELFVREALARRHPRDAFVLTTKLPCLELTPDDDAQKLEGMVEEQLQKCGVDYFDFYLIHSLNAERFELVQKHHMFEHLCELKARGKIRHIGFSFHDKPDVLERILAAHDWEFAQIQLNYLDWELQDAKRQYELIEQKGIQCTIMEPVRGGMLATLTPEAVDCFKQANPSVSTASWAIRYAASLPNVLTVLSGMTNFDHVTDNVATMEAFRPLSQQEREVIDNALAAYRKAVTIPCTGCRYCMDCPAGVSIPEVFAAYNRYATSKSRSMFEELYHALDAGQRADNCIACGTCLPKCPQHIEIPKHMKQIAELAAKKE